THRALAALEADGRIELLLTQNVDCLHQAAGSHTVIDLHGRLDQVRCMGCERRSDREDFQQRRAELFAACLDQLHDQRYKTTIRQRYAEKWGIQSPFVFWNVLSEELLEQALDCLPAEHLRHWFDRLLLDIRANRAGMPDLIQFWPAQKTYRMIEVKGPGDRLQDNQLRWLEFCGEHQMPVTVCYVRWAEQGA
ncbi:MAG: VRR-NUC domain-containing protein, partial [Pseudomonas sp.]